MDSFYCAEGIVDIEQHIFDAIEELPTDEHGFFEGTIQVTVTLHEKD